MTDLSRLVVALKLRFLAALAPDERRAELEHLLSASEQDLARLRDLAGQHDASDDMLGDWLAQDIAQTERRIAWYRARIALT
jgi:predicted amidohydrolase YtcJ